MKLETPYENHLSEHELRWFAIRTRFKDEKVAFKQLEQRGVNAYLPMRMVVKRYGRKIRRSEIPLINSFLFVKIKKDAYLTVLETQYVTGFVKFGQNLLSIPEREIHLLQRLLGEDIEIEVVENQLIEGDWVEVIKGPLLGMRGKLVTIQGKDKVLVELTNSGHCLQVTVDRQLLHKISED